MIQTGQKFSATDLQQSLQEVLVYNIREYIDINKTPYGIIMGDTAMLPFQQTPISYAKICIDTYSDTPSSATALDRQLKQRGIKTTYRFSYDYNTGGLDHDKIVRDAYCLGWFLKIAETTTPHEKYEKEYVNAINDAFKLSYFYAQYLWAQNPVVCHNIATKLYNPKASQWNQIIGAILGIGFQFHPLDVYEFAIEHINPNITKEQFETHYAQQQEFKTTIMERYNIDTGCLVLSARNREKLTKILTKTDTPYFLQLLKKFLSFAK
jgi:hypothetical protein